MRERAEWSIRAMAKEARGVCWSLIWNFQSDNKIGSKTQDGTPVAS